MFDFIKGNKGDEVIKIGLAERVEKAKGTVIRRNRLPQEERRTAGANLYHRADQFLMRHRVNVELGFES